MQTTFDSGRREFIRLHLCVQAELSCVSSASQFDSRPRSLTNSNSHQQDDLAQTDSIIGFVSKRCSELSFGT